MKKFLSYYVVLLLAASAEGGAFKTDREADGLRGRVKTVTTTAVKSVKKGGKWREGPVKSMRYTAYDVTGRRTELAEYTGPSLASRLRYIFRPKSEEPFCSRLKPVEDWNSSFYEEPKSGLHAFCDSHADDGYTTLYFYDIARKPDEPNSEGIDGTLQKKLVTLLGKDGNKKEEYEFDAWDAPESKRTFSYDKAGRLNEAVKLNPADDPLEKKTFSHDQAGNLAVETFYDGNETLLWKKTLDYRNNGTMKSQTHTQYNPDGSVSTRMESGFDGLGNVTRETFYSSESADRYLYEYIYRYKIDPSGNWVKQTRTKMITSYGKKMKDGQEPPAVVNRTIVYLRTKKE
ncbi:MAG: hypothetical protein ABIG11_10475 [bacterium]